MGTLPEKLAEELQGEVLYNSGAISITRAEGTDGTSKGKWQVSLSAGQNINAEYLVLAIPAYGAAHLLANLAPELASQL